jgi:hypothetical protein
MLCQPCVSSFIDEHKSPRHRDTAARARETRAEANCVWMISGNGNTTLIRRLTFGEERCRLVQSYVILLDSSPPTYVPVSMGNFISNADVHRHRHLS